MYFVIERMQLWSFPGSYEDDQGSEPLEWEMVPFEAPNGAWSGFELSTVVRGIPVRGSLDCLEADPANPEARKTLSLDRLNDLTQCTLGGDLPCTVEVGDVRRTGVIRFSFDRKPGYERDTMHLSLTLDGATYETGCDALETGLPRLAAALPPDAGLVCCFTCLYSHYSPGSSGAMGIACHRDAEEQYLAARSKSDMWSVPVTEVVPETYLCPQYQRRVAGAGYRG